MTRRYAGPLAGRRGPQLRGGRRAEALRARPETFTAASGLTPREQESEADQVGARVAALGAAWSGDQIHLSDQRLPSVVRASVEHALGHDFGTVRVHADDRSAAAAEALGAHAFTRGHDISFAAGAFALDTAPGRRLLGHELAHVVQQRHGSPSRTQAKIKVGSGLSLDTKGFSTTKTGSTYTCPTVVKNSVSNEIFTALLSSPRTFPLAGTTNAQANANLAKQMKARLDIITFASKKKYVFEAGSGFTMNPDYWVKNPATGGWGPKPGVGAQEAIQDLNVHPDKYKIACLAATTLTMMSADSPLVHNPSSDDKDWVPGSWGYITNTSFPPGGQEGLEGENLIYVGKDKFWGHFGPGLEYKTLKQWFDQVKSWHGGARIEDQRTHPKAGLA